jgi:uncharacterized protein (TIGR02284 family)
MDSHTEALARLHTQVIDARNGYAEALDLADSAEMIAIFRDLHDMHSGHAGALAMAIIDRGGIPGTDGSFMSIVHKAVLNMRAAITGLEANVLPAIRDGEERMLSAYGEALDEVGDWPQVQWLLRKQIAAIEARIRQLDTIERANA